LKFVFPKLLRPRPQWPRDLRRRSAAARLLGLWFSNPAGGNGCLSVVSVVCCQVEISATGWSLVQRSSTEFGVSACDHESSTMRRPWPTGAVRYGKKTITSWSCN